MLSIPHNHPTDTLPPDELKARFDLRDLFAERYGPGKKAGRGKQYRSPYRLGDDHPSFTVYANGFLDQATGEHGDLFTFIQRENDCSFAEAVAIATQWAGQGRAQLSAASTHRTDSAHSEPPPAAWQQEARRLIDAAKRYLRSGTEDARYALSYLHGRGLTDAAIDAADLGLNPDWKRSQYPIDGKPAKLPPGITIPYVIDGVVWAIRVRTLEAFKGRGLDKYLSFAGSKPSGALYGGDTLEPGRDVLLVEGEFDCLLARQHLGDQVSVATLGSATATLSKQWRERLQAAGTVYMLLDNDGAGQKAAARLAEQLAGQNCTLFLPTGKDVTEYVQAGGDLRAWFDIAIRGKSSEPIAPTVGMERLLNEFGETGETFIYYVLCALRAHGKLAATVTEDDLAEGAQLLGSNIGRKTLRRYARQAGTILNPIDTTKTGFTFVPNSITTIKATLKRRVEITLRQRIYRAEPLELTDPNTGKPYTLPAIPADLEAQAFEDAGLPVPDAASAAEMLKGQTFDEATRRERWRASKRYQKRLAEYCALLDSPDVIPLDEGMPRDSESDLKRAELRAWHQAGIERFQTVGEQMRALGIGSKTTLYRMQADAAIERHENIIPVTIQPGDIGEQVRAAIHDLKAWPATYKVVSDTGEFERKPYNREAIEADRASNTVIVEYQAANTHSVTDLPAPAAKARRPRPEPSERKSDPRPKPTRRGHYSRRWVIGQLKLRYRLQFKQEPPADMGIYDLIEALIDPVAKVLWLEFGATVRKVA